MKTTKVILVFAIAFLFSASYVMRANPIANENKVNGVMEDSTMTNHNHGNSKMGDSTMMSQGNMMSHGDMMAMMQDMHKQMSNENCCAVNDHVTNKNDNSFADPGTKKGSYGYFQYQRQMNNAGKEKK